LAWWVLAPVAWPLAVLLMSRRLVALDQAGLGRIVDDLAAVAQPAQGGICQIHTRSP